MLNENKTDVLVRANWHVRHWQKDSLKRFAKSIKLSESELVRNIVEDFLVKNNVKR